VRKHRGLQRPGKPGKLGDIPPLGRHFSRCRKRHALLTIYPKHPMSTPAVDIANRPLVICGLHRSGTSLTAALFGGAGVNLGDRLFGPDVGNSLGHFEDVGFLEFHMRALHALGHNLEGYVTRPLGDMPRELSTEAGHLVAERMQSPRLWGWKEPRTTLFLDFWDALLPDARYAFVFRNPWDVADSLFRRGDAAFVVDPRLAIEVWLTYNRQIADFFARHPERCVLFEVSQLIANPAVIFDAVRTQLSLPLGEPPDCFRHDMFGRECNPHGSDVVRCLMPEAYELYTHLRRQAVGGVRSPTADVTNENAASEPVNSVALARYTIEEWARASRASVRERMLLAEVAATRADREGLTAKLAEFAAEHQRLARALEHMERERDWLAYEKQQLNAATERLTLALAEVHAASPLRRLAGWFQGRSPARRAA
jgi:hypothetical protein